MTNTLKMTVTGKSLTLSVYERPEAQYPFSMADVPRMDPTEGQYPTFPRYDLRLTPTLAGQYAIEALGATLADPKKAAKLIVAAMKNYDTIEFRLGAGEHAGRLAVVGIAAPTNMDRSQW